MPHPHFIIEIEADFLLFMYVYHKITIKKRFAPQKMNE